MTKEIDQPKTPESLVKTSADGSVELSEAELQQVAGGKKAGTNQQEFLKIKMEDILISSYSTGG